MLKKLGVLSSIFIVVAIVIWTTCNVSFADTTYRYPKSFMHWWTITRSGGLEYTVPVKSYLDDVKYFDYQMAIISDNTQYSYVTNRQMQYENVVFRLKMGLTEQQPWLGRAASLTSESVDMLTDQYNYIRNMNPYFKFTSTFWQAENDDRWLPENDSWWLRDTNNNRQLAIGENFFWVNMNNSEYRTHFVNRINLLKNTGLFAGDHADEVSSTSSLGSLGFIEYRKNQVPDWFIYGNYEDDQNIFENQQFYEHSGPSEEPKVGIPWGTKGGFLLNKSQIDFFETNYAAPKMYGYNFSCANGIRELGLALASCMVLGDNVYFHGFNLPMYKAPIGEATETRKTSPGVDGTYRRNFQNGKAIVNPPGNNPVTVTFGSDYKNWTTGQVGTSFIIHGAEGAIFTPYAAEQATPATLTLDSINGFLFGRPIEAKPKIAYGNWVYVKNNADYYDGNYQVSGTQGDWANVNFHGERARIFGKKGTDCGKIDVYVDNVFKTTVDLYSSANQYQQLIYDTGTITHDNHRIRLVVRGDKNQNSTGTNAYMDYWEYTNNPETIPAPTITKATSANKHVDLEWTNVLPEYSIYSNPSNGTPTTLQRSEVGAGYYLLWGTEPGIYTHRLDVGKVTKYTLGAQEGIENRKYYIKIIPYTAERKDGNSVEAEVPYYSIETSNSIFGSQTPELYKRDGTYDLGTVFYTTCNGFITKVRWFKHCCESGTHTARIWDNAANTLLWSGSITTANENYGWNEISLPQPLRVSSGKQYTVSVSTQYSVPSLPVYMMTEHFFDNPVNSGYVSTIAGSGVYALENEIGTRPTRVYNNSGYFRDVVFVPDLGGSIMYAGSPAASTTYTQGEMGTIFKSSVDGMITSVRLFSGANEGGDHTVRIWKNSTNTVVAGPYTWNFAPGTAEWKHFPLPEPLQIDANTDYTVSISSSTDGYYSITQHGFDSPINRGNLITYTGSGVYTFMLETRPLGTYNNSNYFRDVVFVAKGEQSIHSGGKPSSSGQSSQAEMGTVFKPVVDGKITRIKFYKTGSEGGVHTIRVWRNSDNALIFGPVTLDLGTWTYEGWYDYLLVTPLNVTANTDYTVCVSSSTDARYPLSEHFFDNPVNNGNIVTYTGSGVYTYALGMRPTNVYYNSSYFRDIVFVPN